MKAKAIDLFQNDIFSSALDKKLLKIVNTVGKSAASRFLQLPKVFDYKSLELYALATNNSRIDNLIESQQEQQQQQHNRPQGVNTVNETNRLIDTTKYGNIYMHSVIENKKTALLKVFTNTVLVNLLKLTTSQSGELAILYNVNPTYTIITNNIIYVHSVFERIKLLQNLTVSFVQSIDTLSSVVYDTEEIVMNKYYRVIENIEKTQENLNYWLHMNEAMKFLNEQLVFDSDRIVPGLVHYIKSSKRINDTDSDSAAAAIAYSKFLKRLCKFQKIEYSVYKKNGGIKTVACFKLCENIGQILPQYNNIYDDPIAMRRLLIKNKSWTNEDELPNIYSILECLYKSVCGSKQGNVFLQFDAYLHIAKYKKFWDILGTIMIRARPKISKFFKTIPFHSLPNYIHLDVYNTLFYSTGLNSSEFTDTQLNNLLDKLVQKRLQTIEEQREEERKQKMTMCMFCVASNKNDTLEQLQGQQLQGQQQPQQQPQLQLQEHEPLLGQEEPPLQEQQEQLQQPPQEPMDVDPDDYV